MMRLSRFYSGYTFILGALFFSGAASALETQQSVQGNVAFDGNIIESACAIHPDSHQQNLILSDVSADRFIKQGHSEMHPFAIRLFNCSPARSGDKSWLAFQITFYGEADGNNFALLGGSQGMAIEIQDDRGFIAKPGVAMPPHPVPEGDRTMNYNLRLVGNSKLLRGGSHFTSLNYKLDYY
ncbi:fimbrial protein [Pantoea sp. USHLN256]|uniref:fimbrial protein n=1 Tax=Pantoea sp. USHLN256 TaxID=3081293 RepID=UPI00301AB82A